MDHVNGPSWAPRTSGRPLHLSTVNGQITATYRFKAIHALWASWVLANVF